MDGKKVVKFPVPGRNTGGPSNRQISFGSVIKERRKAADMTQAELAERMGVIRNTVVNWEADKAKPEYDTIPSLCDILGISVEELFGFHGKMNVSDDEEKLIKNYRSLSPLGRNMAQKALFGMLQAESESEGISICSKFALIEEDRGAYAAGTDAAYSDSGTDALFLRITPESQRADFIAHVQGQSMEPVYHDGDIVYCVRTETVESGQDVVCKTNQGKLIKRIAEDGSLFSVNPEPIYKVRKMYDDDDVHIVGVVIGKVKQSDYPSQHELITLNELRKDEIREFKEEHSIID